MSRYSKIQIMSPIIIIAVGTLFTIIGAIIVGIGTYRQHLASSEKSTTILELSKMNNALGRENKIIVERSRDSITNHFNKELADFGIKYDESQERFKKVLNETISRESPKPALIICPDKGVQFISHENNVLRLKMFLCGVQALCVNVNLKINTFTLAIDRKEVLLIKDEVLIQGITMPPGIAYEAKFNIANQDTFDRVFILIQGSHWDSSKTIEQKVEILYVYDVKSKAHGYATGTKGNPTSFGIEQLKLLLN
jgi:hypothetical protein